MVYNPKGGKKRKKERREAEKKEEKKHTCTNLPGYLGPVLVRRFARGRTGMQRFNTRPLHHAMRSAKHVRLSPKKDKEKFQPTGQNEEGRNRHIRSFLLVGSCFSPRCIFYPPIPALACPEPRFKKSCRARSQPRGASCLVLLCWPRPTLPATRKGWNMPSRPWSTRLAVRRKTDLAGRNVTPRATPFLFLGGARGGGTCINCNNDSPAAVAAASCCALGTSSTPSLPVQLGDFAFR